jgi:hypothetical protein
MAFSLRGEPEALEPAVGTIQFDAETAASLTRDFARVAPEREPGSDGASAAADWVLERFEDVASGTVAEQQFEASVDGSDLELRNVLLTLRGTGQSAILIVADRSSGDDPGVASSAAATGVLAELAAELGVSGRQRTLILGSIDGGAATTAGVRELIDGLPDTEEIDAAVVISQPGAAALTEPHLVTSSGADERPSLELIRTTQDALDARARVSAGLDGALGQIARLAIPAAAGTQAALLTEGLDAVAISSAGEVPLPASDSAEEDLAMDSLERFGATTLALVGALDSRTNTPPSPSAYVQIGSNTVPGWTVSVLALSLLIPPALSCALLIAGARRDGTARRALGWAAEWAAVALTPLLALLVLGFLGLIPGPELPYDPGRFGIGATEVAALLVLTGTGVVAWWVLGLRRMPALDGALLGTAAGAVCVAACVLAWLANPFLALVLAPLAHVVVVHSLGGLRRAALAVPAAVAGAVPLAATVLHLATTLDWGLTTPWQLVVLVAGGGLGLFSAAAIVVALGATVAVVEAAQRAPRPSLGAPPQAGPRGRP